MLNDDTFDFPQSMVIDYEEFTPKIDEVNDLGTTYDAVQRGDLPGSPTRRSKIQASKRMESNRKIHEKTEITVSGD